MATVRAETSGDIPDTRPAIESIGGLRVSKVSPRRRHDILQVRVGGFLADWAGERGEVGSEWRFYLDSVATSLVPDVAYYSFERLSPELGELRERTPIAPDIAVEIVSPDDRSDVFERKIQLYLENGTSLVVLIDSESKRIDYRGSAESYPDLRFDPAELFKNL